jgi:hypothetical protein
LSSTAAHADVTVQRLPWETVRDYFAREHKLGEHVAAEGPTGSGKTLAIVELLKARGKRTTVRGRPVSITAFGVKRRDETMQRLVGDGWKRIRTLRDWPPAYGEEHCVAWPNVGPPTGRASRLRPFFRSILDEIDESGNQIVFVDEEAYFERPAPHGLGMAAALEEIWTTSRSNGVTLVATTQRPRRVTLSMWSESYWLILFRPEDEQDLKRVAELSGFKQTILDVVPTLGAHEFLMLRRRPERVAIVSQVKL